MAEFLGKEKTHGDVQLSAGMSLSLSGIFLFMQCIHSSCNSSSKVNLCIVKSVSGENAIAIFMVVLFQRFILAR